VSDDEVNQVSDSKIVSTAANASLLPSHTKYQKLEEEEIIT